MWVRKKIDIGLPDLASAFAGGVSGMLWPTTAKATGTETTGSIATQSNATRTDATRRKVSGAEATCDLPGHFVQCLSVRTGFDALLQQSDWPAGSEIIMTAITIPDMPRIAGEHGYRCVGVDIDATSLAPTLDAIRAKLTARTRAIVVTHLTGGMIETDAIASLCRRHGLMLIEDCAQAFVGYDRMLKSAKNADVSMWSFGPIKTATALGGGLISVRDRHLRRRMESHLQSYPAQTSAFFARRVMKYSLLLTICHRLPAATLAAWFRVAGSDHDRFVAGLARGFTGPDFFSRIRRRPSRALTCLLRRRLGSDVESRIDTRRTSAAILTDHLKGVLPIIGSEMIDPTYWLFGLLAEEPQPLIDALWRAGFDATNRSSLRVVTGDDSNELPNAERILRHMVLLPLGGDTPASEIQRMAETVRAAGPRPPEWFARPPAAAERTVTTSSFYPAGVSAY